MPTTYGILIKNGINYSHDTAESISYSNTTSGLTSTNVQDAIDELNSKTQVVSKSSNGLCPALPNEDSTTKYLRQDGTWVVPPNDNTTYSAGNNITLSGTTFSLTKANVTTALGYTPPTANTDSNVSQTNTTAATAYRVLYSGTATSVVYSQFP